jgi:hypothetical protein
LRGDDEHVLGHPRRFGSEHGHAHGRKDGDVVALVRHEAPAIDLDRREVLTPMMPVGRSASTASRKVEHRLADSEACLGARGSGMSERARPPKRGKAGEHDLNL